MYSRVWILSLGFSIALSGLVDSAEEFAPLAPVPFNQVKITDSFWSRWLEVNRTVTLPHNFRRLEETGVIDNFRKAAGRVKGPHTGILNQDEQLYKAMEAAAYTLALHPDPQLECDLEELVELVAAAQEEDGYLNTKKTVNLKHGYDLNEKPRFSNIQNELELYLHGHMFEAAVAHYQTTGRRTFLEVAIKAADLITEKFSPGKIMNPPGHEEIELALVKLYRATGYKKYLDLAKFFIDQRGNSEGHNLYGPFHQDHKPFIEQTEAVGQAPRATYLYSGAADVAWETGNPSYIKALNTLWDNVVNRKMYITGGIGSRHENEGFGEPYELPNRSSFCENCAAISFSMWNHRMFLLNGEGKYLDVLERTVYNAFLAGVSLYGDRFFYATPVESDGRFQFNIGWLPSIATMYQDASAERKSWFVCACCPPNVARFISTISQYMYATRDDAVYINFFIQSEANVEIHDNQLRIQQVTEYPWDGKIKITVEPEREERFSIYVRIPDWVLDEPMVSELYWHPEEIEGRIVIGDEDGSWQEIIKINKEKVPFVLPVEKAHFNLNADPIVLQNGFIRIDRFWKHGDTLEVNYPMRVRRVLCDERVKDNIGKVALERGPIVYCAEWPDNNGHALNLLLEDEQPLSRISHPDLLQGVTTLEGKANAYYPKPDGSGWESKVQDFTAIPYYAWSNRGAGEMAVWLWRDRGAMEKSLDGIRELFDKP